jgi:arylsulfatase A-like enzyme
MVGRVLAHYGSALFGAVLSALIAASPIAYAGESVRRSAEEPFAGEIGFSMAESVPSWPEMPEAPDGAPNIILILLDDVGFGAAGTFGGPVATPGMDELAQQGLTYNRFHTTALCSPTRAALLTGRNHHRVGFGSITGFASGYPGYNALWKRSTVSVAEVLRRNGYGTAAFGKWHNTPVSEVSPVGPFDRWPTSLGFEYFYGVFSEVSQWEPAVYRNTVAVKPNRAEDGRYHLTSDLVDEAIGWLDTHDSLAPDKPFFIYFATQATHGPHHVPREWIDRYRGRFDKGWDALREEIFARQQRLGTVPDHAVLTPRPQEIPAWESLSQEQQRLYSRQMAVYAGFLAHTDHEVGRLLARIRSGGHEENTLILYIVGDNGGSAEGGLEGSDAQKANTMFGLPSSLTEQLRNIDELGGPLHDNLYSVGWAWATSTPFQWMKQVASHLGGTRNPMIVSWPARIKGAKGRRSQFTHVVDVAATLYEATGIALPEAVDGVEQEPLDGTSFLYTFDDADAPSTHQVQYFEIMGNRAIYEEGWLASARHSLPWSLDRSEDFTDDRWELYRIAEDFSQSRDLSTSHPEKLAELKKRFDAEARENGVYPLNNAFGTGTTLNRNAGSSLPGGARSVVFRLGTPRLPLAVAPRLFGSHRIEADVSIPAGGAKGVIISSGGRQGGYALYVRDDRLVYESNFFGKERTIIRSGGPLPEGTVRLGYEFTRTEDQPFGGGRGRLFVNGRVVGEGDIPHIGPSDYHGTFGVGRAYVSPIGPGFELPNPFSGRLDEVRIDLK